MSEFSSVPNIGKTLEKKLQEIDINTISQLAELGAEKAILKMAVQHHDSVCINMLMALEGAIQNIRWHHLPDERKAALKLFWKEQIQ